MATVDSIGSSLTSGSSGSPKADAFSALSSQQFVKIMFSELANQDPLKPNDSNALMQQMANLRSIESNLTLEKKLDSLVKQNQLASAGGLIGSYISGVSIDNQRVEGLVGSISRTDAGPVLNLRNGQRVLFDQVDEIVDPRALPTTPTTPPTTTPPTTTPPTTPPTATPRPIATGAPVTAQTPRTTDTGVTPRVTPVIKPVSRTPARDDLP